MKKFALFVITMLMLQNVSFARPTVFSEDGNFGLKNEQGETIVDAKYKKLIRLGESSWIMQSGSKFGIIDDSGTVLVDAKYSKADRILGKFAKFAKGDKVKTNGVANNGKINVPSCFVDPVVVTKDTTLNTREGNGVATDNDVVMAVDPVSKVLGSPRGTAQQRKASPPLSAAISMRIIISFWHKKIIFA